MTTSIEISESVRHYYGQVLQSSNDLKTSACCSIDAMPAYLKALLTASRYAEHFQVLGEKSRHFGLFDCTQGPQGDSAETGLCC